MQALEATLRAGAGAVSFLTRIPVGSRVELGAEDVARGAVLFPVVGAGLGALVGLTVVGLDARLSALLAAALAVAVEAVLTGAIHLDALADSADGLGAASRERALEIMREPTIGAFGAVALLVDLLVKTAALAAVAVGPRALLAVAAAYALGRAAPLALGWALPYARMEGGSGSVLTGGAGEVSRAIGVGLGIGLAVAALGLRGIALVAAAAIGAAAVGLLARRRLGGVTGDVLGASAELGDDPRAGRRRRLALMLALPDRGEATRLLLVRHGETEESTRGRCYGRLDVGLSPEGRRRSEKLAAALAETPLAAVYSSTLSRALDTAAAIAERQGLDPVAEDDLREIDFGELEGLTYDEVREGWPELYREWMERPDRGRIPRRGGLCVPPRPRAPGRRRDPGAPRGEAVAVVAHGGVVRVVLADVLGLPPRDLPPGARLRWDQRRRLAGRRARRAGRQRPPILARMTPPATAVVLTVGNEIVCGDVENTNASWLARRLAELGDRGAPARRRARRGRGDRRLPPGREGRVRRRHRHRRARRNAGRPHPRGGGRGVRRPERGDPGAGRGAAGAVRRARPRRLRRALGAPPAGSRPAREPARRRSGVRARQRPRPARAPARDGGDVRDARRSLPRGRRSAPGGAATATGRGADRRVLEEATRRHPEVRVGSYPSFRAAGPRSRWCSSRSDAEALARRPRRWPTRAPTSGGPGRRGLPSAGWPSHRPSRTSPT